MAFPDLKEIFNGHMDDAQVFFDAQFNALRRDVCSIRSAVDSLDVREEWVRRKAGGKATGGATALDITLPGPRPGFMWIAQKLICNVPSGTTSIGVAYAGGIDPANAMDILDEADFCVKDLGGGYPVFSNMPITFSLTGMPANGSAVVAVVAKELKVPE